MNLKDRLAIIAAIIGISSSAVGAGFWVADTRYVTHNDMAIREIRVLNRQINQIERKEAYNIAQPYELDYKRGLELEVQDLQLRLNK